MVKVVARKKKKGKELKCREGMERIVVKHATCGSGNCLARSHRGLFVFISVLDADIPAYTSLVWQSKTQFHWEALLTSSLHSTVFAARSKYQGFWQLLVKPVQEFFDDIHTFHFTVWRTPFAQRNIYIYHSVSRTILCFESFKNSLKQHQIALWMTWLENSTYLPAYFAFVT